MILRIKLINGRLECEYSESKNDYFISWTPIQLSESAENYIGKKHLVEIAESESFELSPTECENLYVSQISTESGGYILRLKEPVSTEMTDDEIRARIIPKANQMIIEQSQDELFGILYCDLLDDLRNRLTVSKAVENLKSKFTIKIKQ